ncbi:transposase [Paraburkholderia youngii]
MVAQNPPRQTPPLPRPLASGGVPSSFFDFARSASEPYREWIEQQVRLKRNAQAIYQDLVDQHGFTASYESVKRFVRALRHVDPEQFDRLEYAAGEEAQVDYGEGAPARDPKTGRSRRPRLFVMTLRYSRRSFRGVVWKSSKQVWTQLHEEAFRYFGGSVSYVVLDNLREGEIREAELFVATLGASNYTYVEVTRTQQLEDWIGSHVRALNFIGGCVEILVSDNRKSGVHKADFYDPVLNRTYGEMTAQEDLDSCLRIAHVDLLPGVAVRDRVIVLVELDVVIDAHTRNFPLCILIRPFWQRPKCRAVEFLEGAAAIPAGTRRRRAAVRTGT